VQADSLGGATGARDHRTGWGGNQSDQESRESGIGAQ